MGKMIENYDVKTIDRASIVSPARVVCENPDSMFNYFAWPTVTRLPDGRLAFYASGMRTRHVCPFGKVTVVYSEDDGATWSKPEILINTPLDDRDAGVAVSGERVCITTFNNTVAFQLGITESEPMTPEIKAAAVEYLHSVDAKAAEERYLGSLYCVSEDGGKTFGDLKKVPVTAPHGPCVLPNGKFFYVGTLYGICDSVTSNQCDFAQVQCYVENDKGEFEYFSSVPNIVAEKDELWELADEPHVIALPSGRIIVHIRAQRFVGGKGAAGWEDFTLYQSMSDDGGKTFSRPEPLLPVLGGAPPHLFRHSSGAIISAYGYREYVDQTKPSAVCALVSRDEGESWKAYYLTGCDHSWDMGYPSTVELADGSLLTGYYDHDGDGPAVLKQVVWRLDN